MTTAATDTGRQAGEATGDASLVRRVSTVAGRAQQLTPVRVWSRLSQARGGVLVQGIAYAAFFSLFPILALAFTVFGVVLRGDTVLQQEIVDYLQDALPGVVGGADPLIDTDELVNQATEGGLLTLTGVVGVLTLIWAALGWVGALRIGIRAAMGLDISDFNPLWAKVRDLLVALLLGGTVIVSAAGSLVLLSATEHLLDRAGVDAFPGSTVLTRVLTFVVVAALDTVLFYLQYRVLAAATFPARHLLRGAVAAAIGFGLLKQAAGLLLAGTGDSTAGAALGAAVGVLALLVWLNFVARVTLLGAAYAGLSHQDELDRSRPSSRHVAAAVRELAGGGLPATARAPGPSARAQDRVVIAAGMIMGATAVMGVGLVGSGLRALGRLVRRDD